MSDCSSCIRPPWISIVADILNTYKKLVTASNNQMWLLPQPLTLLQPLVRWAKPVLSTLGENYHEIHPRQYQSWNHHQVQFRRLYRQMPWPTMQVSHYWQQYIGHVAHNVHLLYVRLSIQGRLPRYGYTHIQLYAASYSCCFQFYGQFLNVQHRVYFC